MCLILALRLNLCDDSNTYLGKTGVAVTYFTSENAQFADELIDIMKEAKQEVPTELMAMKRGRGGSGG